MKPTVGSLFAGIGGIDLGLERAGFQTVWQVEKDEYARRVLAKHWPDVARYGDVRYFLGGKRWRRVRSAWSVDLIAGGFPCQDISYAGKGAGIEGSRSGLWSEFERIIRLLRPRVVFVENVPALLARGLGRVLGDLAACGYDAEWDCIPACAVGAPHRRDRLFVVAYAEKPGLEGSGLQRRSTISNQNVANTPRVFQGRQEQRAERQRVGTGCQSVFSDAHRRRCFGQKEHAAFTRRDGPDDGLPQRNDTWLAEPDVGRVADGVPARVDRLRGLGNAVVPQVAEWIGRRLIATMQGDL